MYEELIVWLRAYVKSYEEMFGEGESSTMMGQAADAIEELSAHYCPHAIRNVHDRGDDSLCRALGAEPPKEEALCMTI